MNIQFDSNIDNKDRIKISNNIQNSTNELKKSENKNDINNNDINNNEDYTDKQIEEVIKKINSYLEDEKTHAEFSRHDVLNRTIIKIVDDETDEVIIEAPPEKILDAVAKMCEDAGILFDKRG